MYPCKPGYFEDKDEELGAEAKRGDAGSGAEAKRGRPSSPEGMLLLLYYSQAYR